MTMAGMEYKNDMLCLDKINISDVEEIYSIDNPEWLNVIIDSSNHIIEGTQKNGTKYIGLLDSPIINSTTIDYKLENILRESKEYTDSKTEVSYNEFIENDALHDFLNVGYDSSDYSYTMVLNVASKYPSISRKDLPLPITIKWSKTGNAISQTIKIFKDNVLYCSYEIGANLDEYDVYNLIPNQLYIVKIEELLSNGEINVLLSKEIKPSGKIRMIKLDGSKVSNFRDIGGWDIPGNKQVAYDKLIRGGEVLRDEMNIHISEAGIYEFVNVMKIDTELDFGDIYQTTVLEDHGVEFLHDHDVYGFYAYDHTTRGLGCELGRELIHNCLDAVITRLNQNKKIYFHCNAGADRTGTFAFLINGVLGVSESDLAKDYELTTFSIFGNRLRNVNADPARNEGYKTLVNFVKQNYNGATLQEKLEDLFTRSKENSGLYINSEQLNILKEKMIVNKK